MSDRQHPRNLTPSFTAPDEGGTRPWKEVGADCSATCTFCGGSPTEAVVGCPDSDAPVVWQVAICAQCLTDTIIARFAEVKHHRTVALARGMIDASNAIRDARQKARWERYERNFPGKELDPAAEAEAARKLAEEEEGIARKFDMCPGWSYDEHQKGYQQASRERLRRDGSPNAQPD